MAEAVALRRRSPLQAACHAQLAPTSLSPPLHQKRNSCSILPPSPPSVSPLPFISRNCHHKCMSHVGRHSSSTDPSPHSLLGPIKGAVSTPSSPAPILTLIFHPPLLEHHPRRISTAAATAPRRPAIFSVLPLPSTVGEVPLLPLFPPGMAQQGPEPQNVLTSSSSELLLPPMAAGLTSAPPVYRPAHCFSHTKSIPKILRKS
jgi:hypothetical protein